MLGLKFRIDVSKILKWKIGEKFKILSFIEQKQKKKS